MVAFEYLQYDPIFGISEYRSFLRLDVDSADDWIHPMEVFVIFQPYLAVYI